MAKLTPKDLKKMEESYYWAGYEKKPNDKIGMTTITLEEIEKWIIQNKKNTRIQLKESHQILRAVI